MLSEGAADFTVRLDDWEEGEKQKDPAAVAMANKSWEKRRANA